MDKIVLLILANFRARCKISDHCHISTGAIINGDVEVGRNTFIGSGSVIKQNVKIGKFCFVNANKFISNLKDIQKLYEKKNNYNC